MPQALEDAFLLRRFPGRFLHEIDEIDLPRHSRAWEAERIHDVEQRRRANLGRGVELTSEEWEQIREHDELLAEAKRGAIPH